MFRKLTRLVLATVALCASGSAFAEGWSVSEYRDPANAQIVRAARTENGGGFSVTIFRNEDRKVRWVLALPQGSFDRLTEAGRIAAYRVDNGDASSIEVKETRISDPVLVDGTTVRALLWHGDDASPARGTLRNMLDGETLTVRFFLDDGKTTDTTFAMAGGPDTIAQALGIEVKADPAEVERVQSRDDAILAATSLCMGAADVRQCAGVLAKCMGPDANALKAADLKSCMTSAGYRLQ